MTKKFKSIISNAKKCYLCGAENCQLEKHHIMNGPKRDFAEADGLYVYLCQPHDIVIGMNKNGSFKVRHDPGCHRFVTDHPEENRLLKAVAQDRWMDFYHKSLDEWIERYGRNYENDR